jgi:hypothetical protein
VQDLSSPLVLLLVPALVVIAVLAWRLRRADAAAARERARQIAAQERAARAVAGEWGAPALLASAGYEVLGRQVTGSWTVRANGEPKTFGLRADYLVSRGGRRFIAEVKTGRLAPNLTHGATRRQLLEYGAAFDVDGVLLVDADRETITHVEIDVFAGHRAPQPIPRPLPTTLVAAVCLCAGILIGVAMAR